MKNRTQQQIDEDNIALMHVIEEENMDMHDNCDMNICEECWPKRTI